MREYAPSMGVVGKKTCTFALPSTMHCGRVVPSQSPMHTAL